MTERDDRLDASRLAFFDAAGVVIENGGNAELRWCRHQGVDHLFKQFSPEHRAVVNERNLLRLVRWRRDLPAAVRERLDALTAWPRAAVQLDGALAGVLITAAGPRYFTRRRDGNRTPRALTDLIGAGSPGARVPPETFTVLGRLILAVRWLHAHQVIIDDLQPENVLYAVDGPATGVYVVDCDSMVSPEHWDQVGPSAAPDLMHEVQPAGGPATVATDLGKLKWIIVRILLEEPSLTEIGQDSVDRLADAVPRSSRPTLLGLLEQPVDGAAWEKLGRQWSAMPAPAAERRAPEPAPPARPRGWLPAGYAYEPAPGPPVLPARLRGRGPGALRRAMARRTTPVLATLAAIAGVLITVLVRLRTER
jgi:hypothetical protein